MLNIEKNEPEHSIENNGSMNISSNSCNLSTSSSSSSSSSMNFNSSNRNLINDSTNSLTTSVDTNNNNCTSVKLQPANYSSNMLSASTESLCGDNDLSSFNDFSSKTNLIVNYLPQNMTQDEIKSLFSSIGPVDSCKLIKDKLSGQSLGYAFVNFSKQEDADKAISTLNGMRLQNKTIKVSLARPSSDSIKNANLYVCGLPKDFSQSDLEKMFSPFGTIISSKILTDPKTAGVSKGVGFVRFDQRMEAENAIAKLNNKIHENLPDPLVVKFANTPTSIKSVMGLPLAPFVPTCRGFFQPYRSSTNSSYRYSPISGYCTDSSLLQHQTSGILTPTTNNSLSNSLNCSSTTPSMILPVIPSTTSTSLPPQPIVQSSGQMPGLTASPPTSMSNSSLSSINYSGWCIFVYNLGPETDESVLWQLFGPFGAVQSVKIIRDVQSLKCKGFGFITMTNYDEAITAINCLNGLNLQNRILQVSFKTNKPFF